MNLSPNQLGVCSWSLKPDGLADLLDRVGKLGLRKVQLGLNALVHDPQNWSDVGPHFADAGIEIVSGTFGCAGDDYTTPQTIRATGGIVPDQFWEANWQIVQDAAEQAEKLGLGIVSTHIGFLPEDPDDPSCPKVIERIVKIADRLAASGTRLLFETGQETAETLQVFLDRIGRDELGVNFDPANMILYEKGDPIDALKKLLPRIVQCHIKDAVATTTPGTWGTEMPVGTGDVDWHAFLDALAAQDFSGNLIIEREGGVNRDDDVRTAIDHLSKLIG